MLRLSSLPLKRALFGAAAVAFVLGTGSGAALAATLNMPEDFELIPNNSTDFIIESGDVAARFTGGFSGIAFIPELYHSGTHAWMVNPGDTGRIEFETNAAEVQFFARALSTADGNSVLTAFDEQGAQVGDSITLNPVDPFQQISLTGPIRRIEFVNNATCDGCMNAIDDFGFSPVPIPAAAWLFGSGLLTLFGLTKRRSRMLPD